MRRRIPWVSSLVLLAAASVARGQVELAWLAGDSLLWGTLAALAYLPALWSLRVIARADVAFGLRLLRSRH